MTCTIFHLRLKLIKANPDEYVCEYDFSPDAEDSNQLAIRETDVVSVKQKWDDSKNPEWWLVENQQGKIGYVPASFLKPQNANGTSH
ncbi:Protein Y37A1B.17 d [Aphelenchoides avenae]|nr:Protein Y37A1B.17 d [Aphelenchus avenae]